MSYKNPFVEKKKRNIDLTYKMIQSSKKIEYNKLIAMLEFRGIGNETAKGYVKVLVDMGSIIIDNRYIKIKK